MQKQPNFSTTVIHDILRLGTGTAFGQIIIVLSAPVLSRIFPPDVFGTFAIINSLIFVLSIISGLRYELAILLPKNDKDGLSLLFVFAGINVLTSIVFGIIFFVFSKPISILFKDPNLNQYLWLTGFGCLIFGLFNGLNYWNTRKERYKTIAVGRACYSLVMIFCQIILGLYSKTTGGLLFGLFMGKIIEDFIQIKSTLRDRFYLRSLSWARTRLIMKKYKKFPQFNTWASLINTLSWQMPMFILAFFFDREIVGLYMMGDRVIRLPMNVIGRAISQVFFQKGTLAYREHYLNNIYRQMVRILSRLGLIPSIILAFMGQEIFLIFLGKDWMEAGVYVQILSMWAFIFFLASPLSVIINIVEKQEKNLFFNTIILLTRLISLMIGGFFNSPRLALWLFAMTGIIAYGWILLWTGHASKVPVRNIIKDIISNQEIWIMTSLIILMITRIINPHPIIMVTVAGLIMAVHLSINGRKLIPLLKVKHRL